ncbi:MAG: UDP-N-acetylglucosamine--LPS N-acetylglucosamine transferase [Geminicoccaceae bacterium]
MTDALPEQIETRRTCWAYSPGGHLSELIRATIGIRFTNRFHVTFTTDRPSHFPNETHYMLCHPRRRFARTMVNALQALWVLCRERPQLILSTGADVAVPILLLGRLMGAKVIFIETGGSIAPSLSGRLIYPFAHLFIVQWPEQQLCYPKAILAEAPLF